MLYNLKLRCGKLECKNVKRCTHTHTQTSFYHTVNEKVYTISVVMFKYLGALFLLRFIYEVVETNSLRLCLLVRLKSIPIY